MDIILISVICITIISLVPLTIIAFKVYKDGFGKYTLTFYPLIIIITIAAITSCIGEIKIEKQGLIISLFSSIIGYLFGQLNTKKDK